MVYTDYQSDIVQLVQKIEHTRPLVLNISNYVIMNITANALLAFGASPMMSIEKSEIGELAQMSHAVVINIGTLNKDFIECAVLAAKFACFEHIPVVLDPVGVAASALRKHAAYQILDTGAVSIIKGNPSEIIALAGLSALSRGVDSVHVSEEAIAAAKTLVHKYNLCVVITGEKDIILDANYIGYIDINVPVMQKITGMGCVASALCGAFLGSEKDHFFASFASMYLMAVVGREVQKNTNGPGSFSVYFLDQLSQIHPSLIHNMSSSYIEKISEG